MRECESCQVDSEVRDPEEQCRVCPKRKRIERFGGDFPAWVANLLDLYDRQQAGWVIRNDDLTLEEWRALGAVHGFYRLRDLELQLGIPRARP